MEYNKYCYTVEDAAGCHVIKNSELTCADCILQYKNAGACLAYQDGKPGEILDGGPCEHKRIE